MAPRKRASRGANTVSKVLPSVETDGDSASPLPDSSNSDETGHPQRYKSWTPKPSALRDPRNEQEIINEQEIMAWYRKHFGERWVELYEAYESEKDHLKDPLKFYDMFKEMVRIEGEKRLEHEREKKAALGRAYIPNWFIPLSETDSDPASPLQDSSVTSDDTYRIPFSDTDSDKSEPMPEDPWERLEYARRHLHLYQSEEEYQEARGRVGVIVEKQREEKERKRVEEAENMAIRWLANTDPLESECLLRRHKLRYMKGLTDEQIDDLDRKEAAAREQGWYLSGNPLQRSLNFLERIEGKTQEQIDAMVREEAAAQAPARERWKKERPPRPLTPLTQDELLRRFGLKPEPEPELEPEPAVAGDPASKRISQPRASSPRLPKDTSRRTRGGRITKNAAQSHSVANRGTRSRRAVPIPVEAPMPNRRSNRQKASDKVDIPDDRTVQVPREIRKRQLKVDKERVSESIEDEVLQKHPITRQRKVYKKERASQRLAERSVAPSLHGTPLRNPSNASKPNSSGPRAPPKKKSIAVKGAKPQGISKSGREGTNRPKRSKKRSED